MRHSKKILPLFIFFTIACNSKSKIHIKVSTTNEINKEMVTTDSSYVLQSDYFETELQSYKYGEFFKAEKDLYKPQIDQPFKLVTMRIVNENGNPIEFKNSTEFLNYMSDNGYQLEDKTELRNYTKYTFKKK